MCQTSNAGPSRVSRVWHGHKVQSNIVDPVLGCWLSQYAPNKTGSTLKLQIDAFGGHGQTALPSG